MAGPLSGVAVTIKDNIDVRGRITRAGAPALADRAPTESDADVVTRLKQAGCIVLGHTNMTELAFSGLGINPHFGTPRNPAFADDDRIPGGSSSGAAVSVALGIAPFAIGTDTGGSVRIPAALCGLSGFKPTSAAVSRRGVVPLSTTLDTVGVIAGTSADCARVFDVIRNPSANMERVPYPDVKGLRLGALEGYVLSGMDETVAATYEKALSHLSNMGAIVRPCAFPELEQIPEINRNGTFPAAESFAYFQDLIARKAALMDPNALARMEAGGRMTAGNYIRLIENRARLITTAHCRAAPFDALVMPTVPVIAPKIADLAAADAYHQANMLILRNPSVVNLLDGCAISIACQEAGAPPVGLTLARMAHEDDALLTVAVAVEDALRSAGLGVR